MAPWTLAAEVHGLSNQGDAVVITVQQWNGPRGRSTVVTARDGLIVSHPNRTLAEAVADLARAGEALAPTSLSAGAARALLATRGVPVDYCSYPSCGVPLPIGCWRCEECGRSTGRAVSGHLSGVRAGRRRQPVTVHIGGSS
jgi:hypothetical protein